MHISIVSPVYRAEKIVDELVKRLHAVLLPITDSYEIILVDDRSPDDSWARIATICTIDSHVKGIRLSRNFGQHHAITAGLDHATGDWVVVMDCDLQDRPEEISKLYNEALKGFDIVFARRVNRTDGFIKKITSQLFYWAFSHLSGIEQDGSIANFGIYSRQVIAAINSIREPVRAFSPMARWVGFTKTSVDVGHGERFEGITSYNYSKLINLALDISIAYSDRPLRMMVQTGLAISLLAILFAAYCLFSYFSGYITVPGYASIITSIWFLSGLIIFMLGIIGIYLGKAFDGIKDRPLYIVDKFLNKNTHCED